LEVIYDAINSGKQLKFSDMNEAIIYKIDKNGNTIKIAVYDKFEEKWIKE
jgi:hypothetical protein